MSLNYAGWPTSSNVIDLVNSISGINASTLIDDVVNGTLSAVTQQVAHATRRQFVTSVATRYFDGSGVGEQLVDEYVSLTDVSIVGFVTIAPFVLPNWYAESDNNYPNTRIAIFQGGPVYPSFGGYSNFPVGRKNISVTGTWGYGATIPADLWQSVCEEAAGRLSTVSILRSGGRLIEWKEGDGTSEKRDITLPGEVAGWRENFKRMVYAYTSPKVHSPKFNHGSMV